MHAKGTSPPSPDQVACRAYEIWRAEGCPQGRNVENWLEAERQLRAGGVTTLSRPPDWEDDGLAAEVERRLDEVTEKPSPRSPTSLDLSP